jgi:hypothetical protein
LQDLLQPLSAQLQAQAASTAMIRTVLYLLLVALFDPHDEHWREMMRNDTYHRKAKY